MTSESRRTQAAAQQLSSNSKLLYHGKQAQLIAEVARDQEVRQLRAQLKRAGQELDMLKKPWSPKCFSCIFTHPTR